MIKDKKYISCSVCGTQIFPADKRVKSIKAVRGFRYIICPDCVLGILYLQQKKQSLENIYEKENYFVELSAPVQNPITQWFFTRQIFQSSSEWAIKNFKAGKILDVGCGNGEFLSDLQAGGWDVWGSDISSFAVKNTGKKIGKNRVKQGEFPNQTYSQKFDVISFWHILEHVENPIDYLEKAKRMLKDDGTIIGEMPNFDSALLRRFPLHYYWFMVPDHILYYSKNSL